MSTKTLRKRIALVAVSALGAGVLVTSPANATAPADLVAGDITTSSTSAATPGVCYVDTTTSSQDVVVVTGYSFVVTTLSGGNGETAALALSGNLTITSNTGWDSATTTTAESSLTPYAATGDAVTIKAGAVGTGKITISKSSTSAALEAISVVIVDACAGSVFSASYSFLAAITAGESVDTNAEASNADSTGMTLVAADGAGYIGMKLANAYNATLDSAAVVATVTSGNAYVNVVDETATAVPTGKSKTAVLASTGAKVSAKVTPITAGVPTVATVQISFDGVVVGSRTFTFEGYAKSIVVTDVVVGKVGADAAGNGVYFRYQVKDSAGNNLRNRSIANDGTANAPSSVTDISSGFVDGDTDATDSTDGSKSADIISANMVSGTVANILCTANGKTSVGVKYVDPLDVTTTIKASVPVICADPLDTWTIAMDKASYQPGEIATLTVSGKDADGIFAPSLVAIAGLEYSFGGMTAVTAPTNGDLFTSGAGIKTYKFAVGTSEGSFVGTFKITGATDTAAKTVQYKVAASSTAISLADVLKAIVSLIASINKQIAALQKALLKK